jgi:hypothetical protein
VFTDELKSNLEQLESLGFTDVALNIEMLQKHRNVFLVIKLLTEEKIKKEMETVGDDMSSALLDSTSEFPV